MLVGLSAILTEIRWSALVCRYMLSHHTPSPEPLGATRVRAREFLVMDFLVHCQVHSRPKYIATDITDKGVVH